MRRNDEARTISIRPARGRRLRLLIRVVVWCVIPLAVEFGVYCLRPHPEPFWYSPGIKINEANISQLETKVYNIRDLIVDQPDHTNSPSVLRPPTPIHDFLDRLRPENWNIFGWSRDGQSDAIVQIMTNGVGPTSWRDERVKKPPHPMIRELQGQLIIRQTPENQRRVVALLARLHCYQWIFQHLPYYYLPWISLTIAWKITKRSIRLASLKRSDEVCPTCGHDLRESPSRALSAAFQDCRNQTSCSSAAKGTRPRDLTRRRLFTSALAAAV